MRVLPSVPLWTLLTLPLPPPLLPPLLPPLPIRLQSTANVGLLLALAVIMILQATISQYNMEVWGWRIAFALSSCTALLGAYLRRGMPEPHAFLEVRMQEGRESLHAQLPHVQLPHASGCARAAQALLNGGGRPPPPCLLLQPAPLPMAALVPLQAMRIARRRASSAFSQRQLKLLGEGEGWEAAPRVPSKKQVLHSAKQVHEPAAAKRCAGTGMAAAGWCATAGFRDAAVCCFPRYLHPEPATVRPLPSLSCSARDSELEEGAAPGKGATAASEPPSPEACVAAIEAAASARGEIPYWQASARDHGRLSKLHGLEEASTKARRSSWPSFQLDSFSWRIAILPGHATLRPNCLTLNQRGRLHAPPPQIPLARVIQTNWMGLLAQTMASSWVSREDGAFPLQIARA